MSITSAIVLYAVLWFMVFFVAIPIRLHTQADMGKVVPGTHSSAPEVHRLRKKAVITTAVAALLWAVIAAVVLSGALTMRDIDMFNRMDPVATDGTDG